ATPEALPESPAAPLQQANTGNSQAPITWTASEYIANQKSSNWYAMLAVAAILIGFVVWLLTRDFFPTVAVLIGVILLGYYAGRQPREQTYALDDQGLTIGGRHMAYHEFRSFTVVQDGAFLNVELTPLKRFAVEATMYVDPSDEKRIISRLSQYLPMEEAKTSFTDSLMRRIKF
ncbi:MAG TPA: hypothetical protein VN778_00955, partial [Verrucomicrobiae bacterium]|nr:hypothetical protein [Verrucomicrobiae bacterium]